MRKPQYVPVLEFSESMEHPEVLGIFDDFNSAIDASLNRAKRLRQELDDDRYEIIRFSNGYDIDDGSSVHCIRVTEVR